MSDRQIALTLLYVFLSPVAAAPVFVWFWGWESIFLSFLVAFAPVAIGLFVAIIVMLIQIARHGA